MSEDESPSDRRIDLRHLACFPANVETKRGTECIALIRNASLTGLQLLTADTFEKGEQIHLSLYIHRGDPAPHRVSARVVRIEDRGPEALEWPFAVAVRFDEPLEGVEDELERLERQYAETFSSDLTSVPPPPGSSPEPSDPAPIVASAAGEERSDASGEESN